MGFPGHTWAPKRPNIKSNYAITYFEQMVKSGLFIEPFEGPRVGTATTKGGENVDKREDFFIKGVD